ncbi:MULTISPECIES: 4a-hydroxytetrahydrobiopterin dehydratase [Variovorax]|uniref:4a-hydroxytetrahydrobiopterin dehydratase n=1 Tax=Variovorax TaxID=34072 RepID=UPI00286B8F86|nr:4a-hydroxytetrahydrobiopterin dehydratase [Variovorax sp. 3319]
MGRFAHSDIEAATSELSNWHFDPDRGGLIRRNFEFADFIQAFGFMTQIAMDAERRGVCVQPSHLDRLHPS